IPSIRSLTSIYIDSWDADVYAALRQFHRAKGFDPDSQDVARHLGYPFINCLVRWMLCLLTVSHH
ncbi:hypothetical protein B0H13DRAFT_1660301, partial [Mycena leptocephala]